MTPDTPPAVRLDEPIVAQVARMAEGYDAWVHRSIRAGTRLTLFKNPLLELLTHVPWWVVPLVWVPVIGALSWASVSVLGLAPEAALLAAALGLAAWTLLEYLMHRFLFHFKPAGPWGRRLHFLGHGIHHLDPWDATRLVFPPVAAALLALPVFSTIWLLVPLATAAAAMAGLLVGYLVYDMTHYHVHHRKCRTRWGKWLKAWHLEHHHRHPEAMYGVSSPVWDAVFRTWRPVR